MSQNPDRKLNHSMEEALTSKGTVYRDEGMGKGASKDVEVQATVGRRRQGERRG